MALLTREQILGATDVRTEDVEVPELGGTVRVRSITARDRDAFEHFLVASRQKGKDVPDNVRAMYVALTVVGEDGELLFTRADVEALGKHSFAALDRIYQAALRLNAMAPEAVEQLAGE